MADFTTWAALKQQMLNDLAARSFSMRDLSKGGHRIVYSTFAEWQVAYDFVCQQALVEAGTAGTTGSCRTHAQDGGRL